MPATVKGVVARSKGAPVEVVDIVVPTRARVKQSSRCRPAGSATRTCTIGSEGSTTSSRSCSATRPPVSWRLSAQPSPRSPRGDFVVLNSRAVCGQCRACAKGKPQYCFATHNATQPMTLTDGTPLSPALGIGAFAEKTLVAVGQCTKADPQAPAVAAGLLGCGVIAGFGATVNTTTAQADVEAFVGAIGAVAERARARPIGAGGLVRTLQGVPG